MYEYLDRRYALALYQVAEEKGKVIEYFEQLHQICEIIYGNEEFYKLIKHPQISTLKKKDTFKNIFKGRIDEDLLSFLLILIEKDRILFLREKLNQMEEIHLKKNNKVFAKVKTVIPLSVDEEKALVEKLEKKFNKTILLEQQIDKSILGGLYVRVGDYVIDGTIKSRLEELKSAMLKRE